MKLRIEPTTLREANAFVAAHHRHSKPVRGAKFCLRAMSGDCEVGVIIVGRPIARALQERRTAEALRCCVLPGLPPRNNVCSFLYAAARRVWQAQGGLRIVTYTLVSEGNENGPGPSLRGAGFRPAAETKPRREGSGWQNRPGREFQAVYAEPKIRWEAAA